MGRPHQHTTTSIANNLRREGRKAVGQQKTNHGLVTRLDPSFRWGDEVFS